MSVHQTETDPPLGIVLLNLGGPQNLEQVPPFLNALFLDREIMRLPAQRWLGPLIARVRGPASRRLYQRIGGRSPVLDWTRRQGELMVAGLTETRPEPAGYRYYIASRYTSPTSQEALLRMRADGVRRAVAFPQYPHFSCATSGASLNELWRAARREGLEQAFEWSVIDTWFDHPAYLDCLAATVRETISEFEEDLRDEVFVLFSAHSLPRSAVDRGDTYPQQVAATTHEVMRRLAIPNPHLLTYQSKTGPASWQGPSTRDTIQRLGWRRTPGVLVVPVAFTSDHVETLVEIDIELAGVAEQSGVRSFRRAPSLNDRRDFGAALATIVADHLAARQVSSPQYSHACPGCDNPDCRRVINPAY